MVPAEERVLARFAAWPVHSLAEFRRLPADKQAAGALIPIEDILALPTVDTDRYCPSCPHWEVDEDDDACTLCDGPLVDGRTVGDVLPLKAHGRQVAQLRDALAAGELEASLELRLDPYDGTLVHGEGHHRLVVLRALGAQFAPYTLT